MSAPERPPHPRSRALHVLLGSAVAGAAALLFCIGLLGPRRRGLEPRSQGEPTPSPAAIAAHEPRAAKPAERSTLGPIAQPAEGAESSIWAVRDEADRPIADLMIALVESGRVLLSGRTDASGEVALPSGAPEITGPFDTERTGALLALPSGAAPRVARVSLAPGRHVVRLERGALVSGRVLVDGAPPDASLALELEADHPLLDVDSELGVSLEALGLSERVLRSVRIESEPGGAFRFEGLRRDWSGALRIPRPYRLKDPELALDRWRSRLALPRPIEDLTVELTRMPRLVGRVLEREGGEPVPDAEVAPAIRYADGRASQPAIDHVLCDERGRFEIVLEERSVEACSLALSSPELRLTREVPLGARIVEGDWDVGDLALAVPRGDLSLAILVEDSSGAPIIGARASSLDGAWPPSAPTDEVGRTALSGLTPGLSSLRVVALGFEPALVAVPQPPPELLVVKLARSTLLRLRFLDPAGSPAELVDAVLTTSEPPFVHSGDSKLVKAFCDAGAGFPWPATDPRDPTVETRLRVGRDGLAVLSGLKQALPLDLRALDRQHQLLGQWSLQPLDAEEHREVELRLERGARDYVGLVLDEEQRPIVGAQVTRKTDTYGFEGQVGSSSSGTDGNGRFRLKHVYAEQIDLGVQKEGYVPFRDQHFELPRDGSTIEIRLRAGQEVRVTVMDDRGTPLEAQVFATLPDSGASLYAVEESRGVYVLRGVPEDEFVLQAYVDQELYEQPHEGTDPEARFEVSTHRGDLTATVWLPEDLYGSDLTWLWLLPQEESGHMRWARIDPKAPPGSALSIDHVLPGSYVAVVRRYVSGRDLDAVNADVTARVPVEVRVGSTTRVHVRP